MDADVAEIRVWPGAILVVIVALNAIVGSRKKGDNESRVKNRFDAEGVCFDMMVDVGRLDKCVEEEV